PADGDDADLDEGSHETDRGAGDAGETGHQPIARARSELRTDVHRRGGPVEDDAAEHECDVPSEVLGLGRNSRVRSSEGPMSRALRIVPMPGCCRRGIQMSSTTKDSRVTMVPKVSGTCLRMPEWSTSQGIMPRPAVTIIVMAAPKR